MRFMIFVNVPQTFETRAMTAPPHGGLACRKCFEFAGCPHGAALGFKPA